MNIGIVGTRGIPNAYGGFEQFAEIFATKMQARGHAMSVYCSSLHPYQKPEWNDIKLIHCKDPEDKLGSFGQFIYDLNCLRNARKQNFDIVLLLGYTSSSIWMRLVSKSSISFCNMDGLEWKRSKYSKRVQKFLEKAEKWAALRSDYLIADSPAIQSYLKEKYAKESRYIAYGAELFHQPKEKYIEEFGLRPGAYSLLIARSEPENNIHMICEAYQNSQIQEPLLIIGNFANTYGIQLQEKYKSPLIQFIGPLYKAEKLNNLRYYSRLYFHGHSVGGTNPSLLEAMASSALICAHRNEFNQAVLLQNAFYFETAEELKSIINASPIKENNLSFIQANLNKINDEYSWSHITDQLENYFLEALEK